MGFEAVKNQSERARRQNHSHAGATRKYLIRQSQVSQWVSRNQAFLKGVYDRVLRFMKRTWRSSFTRFFIPEFFLTAVSTTCFGWVPQRRNKTYTGHLPAFDSSGVVPKKLVIWLASNQIPCLAVLSGKQVVRFRIPRELFLVGVPLELSAQAPRDYS